MKTKKICPVLRFKDADWAQAHDSEVVSFGLQSYDTIKIIMFKLRINESNR